MWHKLGNTDGQADTLIDLGDELFQLSEDLALNSYI